MKRFFLLTTCLRKSLLIVKLSFIRNLLQNIEIRNSKYRDMRRKWETKYCMKSVLIWSFSCPNTIWSMRTDQKNSVYKQFSRSRMLRLLRSLLLGKKYNNISFSINNYSHKEMFCINKYSSEFF